MLWLCQQMRKDPSQFRSGKVFRNIIKIFYNHAVSFLPVKHMHLEFGYIA